MLQAEQCTSYTASVRSLSLSIFLNSSCEKYLLIINITHAYDSIHYITNIS